MSDSHDNKIIVWMQMTLDGYTAGPNGEFDWPTMRGELHEYVVDSLRGAGAFCYGRHVYDMMASYWPTADEDPASTKPQIDYARIWKPMPKLVFSTTLHTTEWSTTVIDHVDETEVKEVAGRAEGDVYLFGGAGIVSEFARKDLVDEYQIFLHPIVLGAGTPLFPALPERQPMSLVETRQFDDSVVSLRYSRNR
jgi:dihydrofolate reductase